MTPDFSQRRISFAVTVGEEKRRSSSSSFEDEDTEKSDDMEEATDEISEMQPRVTKRPQEKKASWRQVNIHCIQSGFNN